MNELLRVLLSFILVVLHLPRGSHCQTSIIQVPCLQTFSTFTKNWETDCSSPCNVVCHGACFSKFSAELITGTIFYTSTTPLCLAAIFEGTISNTGGSFAVRDGGDLTQFTSSRSKAGNGHSQSSNTTQPSWFIEPYERVRFIKEPEDTVVQLGEYLTLTCLVNSRSRPRVTWYNNGREVPWSTTVDCKGEECQVQHAEKSHAGLWQCKVSTDYSGTLLSRYSHVTVAYLNETLQYQPRDFNRAYSGGGGKLSKINVHFTWPLVLPCSIDSQPPAHVTWYKNDDVFNDRHAFLNKDGSLYFMTVDEKDTGSYKCNGYNSVTNQTITSTPYWLQKEPQASRPGPVPSSIIPSTTSSTIIAKPGFTVTVTCVARGNPIPTISWSVPDAVRDSPRISTPSFGRNLIITDVRTTDAGEYKCTGLNENDYGMGATFISRLMVVTFPTFEIVPDDATYNKGEEAVLRCGLQNRGSMSWLKNGQQLELVRSKIELAGDYLVIKDVSAEDIGMYQCVGKYVNDDKFVTQASAMLSVRSKPKISVSADNLLHEAGQTIHIRCIATGYPYPYVSWYKNGRPMVFTDRIRQTGVQSIVIEKANGLDYGEYNCVARNYLGTDSLDRELNVIVKAHIKSIQASDERGYYLSGDKIQLTCVAAGSKDISITWYKDNSDYLASNIIKEENIVDVFEYVVTKSVMTIPSSNLGDQGIYKCLVSNYLGKNKREVRVKVYPEAVPPQLMTGPINTVLTQENNMLVTCVFTGAPPPRVLWKINNKVATENGRITLTTTEDGLTANLMIKDATKSDSGNYSCEGTNMAGQTDRGVLPIYLYYTDANGLSKGTNSTLGLFLAIPYLFFFLLFL